MPIRVDRARLKSERLNRGWSQDHLAEASGVSARTIQRLERGGAGAPASLMALAAAMSLPMSALIAPASPVRRITPLTILPDIGPSLDRYRRLGFAQVETDDPGCVGLRAGNTYLILCTAAFMAGDYRADSIAPLTGRTIPYIWVASVDEAKKAYARVVEDVVTRANTIEALVGSGEEWAVLAETMA